MISYKEASELIRNEFDNLNLLRIALKNELKLEQKMVA